MLASRRLAPVLLVLAACSGGGGYGGYSQKTASAPSAPYPGRPVAQADYAAPGVATAGAPARDSVAVNPYPSPAPDERPGLGTSWGEQVYSPATMQPFVRAAAAPWAAIALHYNDRDGVLAHAAYLGGQMTPLEVYAGDGSIGIALVDENGTLLSGINSAGRALIAGNDGERYRIVVRNGTSARFEIVASVDGNDVIDGKPAEHRPPRLPGRSVRHAGDRRVPHLGRSGRRVPVRQGRGVVRRRDLRRSQRRGGRPRDLRGARRGVDAGRAPAPRHRGSVPRRPRVRLAAVSVARPRASG